MEAVVAVRAEGAVGIGQEVEDIISIPFTSELLITVVNLITYWPEGLAAAVNCWMLAIFFPPAAAKMSKPVSACVPLMLTLNTRCPGADQ